MNTPTIKSSITETLRNATDAIKSDSDVIEAALTNAFIIRARQLGRKFVTPIDMRKKRTMMAVMMTEPAEGETAEAEQYAIQAQTKSAESRILDAVEAVLEREG